VTLAPFKSITLHFADARDQGFVTVQLMQPQISVIYRQITVFKAYPLRCRLAATRAQAVVGVTTRARLTYRAISAPQLPFVFALGVRKSMNEGSFKKFLRRRSRWYLIMPGPNSS
jgi:hypothetical protein